LGGDKVDCAEKEKRVMGRVLGGEKGQSNRKRVRREAGKRRG